MVKKAQLLVSLQDVPELSRRFEVPVTITLDRLHAVLQAVIGWQDYHLYEFRAGELAWGPSGQEGFGDIPLPAEQATLAELIERSGIGIIRYIYDFGDHWQHSIEVVRVSAAGKDGLRPRLLAAVGACPPEDVGGPDAYAEFVRSMANSRHPEHKENKQWIGGIFDPQDVGMAEIMDRLQKLWAN